uniref:Uncharacterized protein n=1 Tax=Glossina pallidipes TaxID=7398 RepID=A0A1A9ZU59_GLOPL
MFRNAWSSCILTVNEMLNVFSQYTPSRLEGGVQYSLEGEECSSYASLLIACIHKKSSACRQTSEIFIYTSQTSSLQIRANNIHNTNASDSSRSSSNVDNDTDADTHANADDDDNVNVAILDDSKAHFDASVTIQKNGLCSKYHTKC